MRATHASRAASGWMNLDLTLGQIRFLHFLNREGSMSMGRVAEVLGVNARTIERDWLKARTFLSACLAPG